jgi:hypothetical protein
MIRYATLLLLSVCAFGTWAHDPVARQHSETAADTIDGSKNPELIPDSLAFRLYFIALSENDSTLTESTERQKAFFATAGLNAADTEVAASILRAFKKRLDAMTETYNTSVLSTNDSTADRRLFAAKREALVETTRNEFSIMLSTGGAKHLNDHVQGEKQKIKASKSEIQQIAALRLKPTGFQLVSMKSLQGGGGCSGFMDLHYNSYTSSSTNSQGKNIYASTSVDGYTGEGNGSWCYGSVTHQPRLLLQVGTAGGWFYGQGVIPSSQIDYGQNVILLCDLCQEPNSYSVQDGVYCTSLGGLIYGAGSPPPTTIRIAVTNFILEKWDTHSCYYNMYCPNGNTAASCPSATFIDVNGMSAIPACNTSNYVWFARIVVTPPGTCFPVGIAIFSSVAKNCS